MLHPTKEFICILLDFSLLCNSSCIHLLTQIWEIRSPFEHNPFHSPILFNSSFNSYVHLLNMSEIYLFSKNLCSNDQLDYTWSHLDQYSLPLLCHVISCHTFLYHVTLTNSLVVSPCSKNKVSHPTFHLCFPVVSDKFFMYDMISLNRITSWSHPLIKQIPYFSTPIFP